MIKKIIENLLAFFRGLGESLVEQSTEALRLEFLELEHAFLSILLGSLVGLPIVPYRISIELLPLVRKEISILIERSRRGGDVISDLFSTLGGEW